MRIISEKNTEKENNRMIDGINTILSLPEEEFNLFIKEMTPNGKELEKLRFHYSTDECEAPDLPIEIGLGITHTYNRCYYGGKNFTMFQILQECKNMLNNYPTDSLEYSRINKILHTRDLSNFKKFYSGKYDIDPMLLEKVFEMLSSNELLSKFLDYNNNTDAFAINGQEVPRSEYLRHLGEIFGNKDKNLDSDKPILSDFFIPNFNEFEERYLQIFEKINMNRYVNPYFTFQTLPNKYNTLFTHDLVYINGEEPDFKISPETCEAIFTDMPTDLSLEEQAIYVYAKMCTIFTYDEGYLYRDKLNKVNYDFTFSKEHLEEIKPGDKITCYDFARLYAKFVNEHIDGDITAVMISEGINQGHALAGFYTENVSATVEAINVFSDQDVTNDLMKAKNGINLSGINIVSDRDGLIKQAIDKVYPLVLGKQPKSINDFIQELNSIPQENDIPNDPVLKMQSLLEVMKSNNVFGNEFCQTFLSMCKTNYFGNTKLEYAFLGELQKDSNGENRYKRHILLRQPIPENSTNHLDEFYMINTDKLELKKCSKGDIIQRLNSGELIYEKENHKIPGIDKEEA